MRVTAQTKRATQQRIVEVAKRQFARQGFEATTTRDIARDAGIGVGTLFNYFPTKESIVESLVTEACIGAIEEFRVKHCKNQSTESASGSTQGDESTSLEEDLFAYAANTLRKLKPYRKYLPVVLERAFSPLATRVNPDLPSLRAAHLEMVTTIAAAHGRHESLSTVGLQLYWTLYTGVLAFWAEDRSPRQEDTLGLLDESLSMFVAWLTTQPREASDNSNHRNA